MPCYTSNNTNLEREYVKKIRIFDTTLRDGEQSAHCTMYIDEKISIARQLEKINVDVIEAGFAVASKENFETMRDISKVVSKPYLCGLARGKQEDIDATYEALKSYEKRMIHIFVPTSKIQIKAKMNKNDDEIIEMASSSVRYAKKYFDKIEFTAEDTVRTDFDMLKQIYSEVLKEKADIINVADTVGCAYPSDFGNLVHKIKDFVKNINPNAAISVHCHNDLGMALANSLAAIENGVEQIECTINGIGERAGNCSLEQIVAWSIIRPEFFKTNVDPSEIYKASEMVKKATGTRNDFAPVVGEAVFSHKAGIHQQGVINNGRSYEVIIPEIFGRKTEIVIGPHSGYHGMITKASELGFGITKEEASEIIKEISEIVRKKKQKRFSDEDIKELLKKRGRKREPR